MREIEFRGKRIDNDEWVYGYLIVDGISDKYYIFEKGDNCNETDKVGEEGLLHIFTFEVISETVGQYTGLKDKNGKKIYEGDIILYQDWENSYEGGDGDYYINKGIVEYNQDNCCFNVTERNTVNIEDVFYVDNEDLEVIGNIYDNPELLEEGD